MLELRRAEHVLGQVLVLAEAAGGDGCVGVAHVGALTGGRRLDPRAGRARSGGRLELDDGLERIELDLDELGAVLRDRLVLGDHDRQRLAGVDDLLARERLIQPSRAGGFERQIGGGQDGDDAGQCARRVGRDRRDHRVRLVRQHQAGVQQPDDREIGREPRAAAYLGAGIAARSGYTDGGHSVNLAAALTRLPAADTTGSQTFERAFSKVGVRCSG